MEDSVAWAHKSGGGVGSPRRSRTSEGFRSSWPPGCLVTVPNLSPSPPLLLSCHHPAQKSPEIHKVSQPAIWGLPQLTFLTLISVPQLGSFTPASHVCLYPSNRPGIFPFCIFWFPFLECLLPSSSFLHSLPTFRVLTTSAGVISPFSKCRDHINSWYLLFIAIFSHGLVLTFTKTVSPLRHFLGGPRRVFYASQVHKHPSLLIV